MFGSIRGARARGLWTAGSRSSRTSERIDQSGLNPVAAMIWSTGTVAFVPLLTTTPVDVIVSRSRRKLVISSIRPSSRRFRTRAPSLPRSSSVTSARCASFGRASRNAGYPSSFQFQYSTRASSLRRNAGSSTGVRVRHTPSGPRKSGMLLPVEIPAPVNARIRSARRRSSPKRATSESTARGYPKPVLGRRLAGLRVYA